MRRVVAIICVLLTACASTTYWRHAPSLEIEEELHDGSEALLITGDRAIHMTAARIQDGFVRGQVEHVWKIPAGTEIYSTNYHSTPVDLAISRGWLELADQPGPVALSTVRFARILPGADGGGQAGAGKTVFLMVVIGGGIVVGALIFGYLLSAQRLH
jgi:hypothetical protein